MSRFRDELREGRQVLHMEMADPALYIAEWPVADGEEPSAIPVTVRVHEHGVQLGDLKGTSFNYPEIYDDSPKIIFMRDEIAPKRHAVVVIGPGEAWRLGAGQAPNDITVTFDAARLSDKDMAGLPMPE